ncbi:MAG: type 1 glutamine amidotransferase domain-containing protein [Xanthomonadales bacterium]|nr:type 1 glutamine amidotransferase domain-containing protein [Xanthomonadales bacterium]
MATKTILIPLPDYGFDPTEAAIPWKLLSEHKHTVQFATPDGKPAQADELMLTGQRLGIWKPVLRARQDAIDAYSQMLKSETFCNPCKYSDAQENNYSAILLPGGHDKRIKVYLESEILQKLVANFFSAGKPVAAVCHGVVLAARSIQPNNGNSVLHGYKTTALLKSQEMLAYNLTRLWLQDYYLTYPEITVEDEVRSVLASNQDFQTGPKPVLKDSPGSLNRGFALRDRNYLSARWPGDIYNFSFEFLRLLDDHGTH